MSVELIFTTKGDLPVDMLEQRVITEDYPDATTTATEYWLDGECVRRDVNVALKPKDLTFGFTAQPLA